MGEEIDSANLPMSVNSPTQGLSPESLPINIFQKQNASRRKGKGGRVHGALPIRIRLKPTARPGVIPPSNSASGNAAPTKGSQYGNRDENEEDENESEEDRDGYEDQEDVDTGLAPAVIPSNDVEVAKAKLRKGKSKHRGPNLGNAKTKNTRKKLKGKSGKGKKYKAVDTVGGKKIGKHGNKKIGKHAKS